jgi:SAM-dependent methyltransferase
MGVRSAVLVQPEINETETIEGTRVSKRALCYDASKNRYSIVPGSVPPHLFYSMELGARCLFEAWPFFQGNLLDIGCGKKPYLLFIESLVSRYIGIDLPDWVGENESDIWADGQRLPFRSGSFDTVLCTDVLHQVPSPDILFREINRVLKENGHLVLLVSNDFSASPERPTYAHFTAEGLRLLTESAGFNVIVLRSKGRLVPFFFNLGIQITYRAIQKLRKKDHNDWLFKKPNSFWFHRIMLGLQKLLLALTPERSYGASVEWMVGKDPRVISGHFHLGYLLVAKKVFYPEEWTGTADPVPYEIFPS